MECQLIYLLSYQQKKRTNKKMCQNNKRWPPVFIWKQAGPRLVLNRKKPVVFCSLGPRSPEKRVPIRMYRTSHSEKRHFEKNTYDTRCLFQRLFIFTPDRENSLIQFHVVLNIGGSIAACMFRFEGCQLWCAKMIFAGRKSHIDLRRFDGQGAVPEVGCSWYGVMILEQPVRSYISGVFKIR